MASFRGWAMRNPFSASAATTAGNDTTPASTDNTALFEARGSPAGTVDTSWSSDSDDGRRSRKGKRTAQRVIAELGEDKERNATPVNGSRMVPQSVLDSLFDTSPGDLITPRRHDCSREGSTTPAGSPRPLHARSLTATAHLDASSSRGGLPLPPATGTDPEPRGSRTSLKSILKRSSSPFPTHGPVEDDSPTTPGGTKLRWVADDDFEVAEISARTGSESEGDIGRALEARSSSRSSKSSGESQGTADMSLVSEPVSDEADPECDVASSRTHRAGTTSPLCSPPPFSTLAPRAGSTTPVSSPPSLVPFASTSRSSTSDRSTTDDSFDPSSLAYGRSPLAERQHRLAQDRLTEEEDSFDGSSLVPSTDDVGELVEEPEAPLGVSWGWRTGGGPTGIPSPLKEEESWEIRAMSDTSRHEDQATGASGSLLQRLEAADLWRPTPVRPSPSARVAPSELGDDDTTPVRRTDERRSLNSQRLTSASPSADLVSRSPSPPADADAFSTPLRWASRSAGPDQSSTSEEEEPRLSELDVTEEFETFSTPWGTPAVRDAPTPTPARGVERSEAASPLGRSMRPGSPRIDSTSSAASDDGSAPSPSCIPLPASPASDDGRQGTPSPLSRPPSSSFVTPPTSDSPSRPYRTPRLSDHPPALGPGRSPAWQTSLVRTPSRLAQSFVPGSPSSASEAATSPAKSERSVVSDLEGLRSRMGSASPTPTDPPGTPPAVRLPVTSTFPRAVSVPTGIANGGLETSIYPSSPFTTGEARIVSRSADQPLRIGTRDHSFTFSTPSKSFGIDFTSPVAILDWSIQRSREMEAEELSMSVDGEDQSEEKESQEEAHDLDGLEAPPSGDGQGPDDISYIAPERLDSARQPSEEHFEPRASIAPLPDFSPIGLPSFGRTGARSAPRKYVASAAAVDSPLAHKTTRLGMPSSSSAPASLDRLLSLPDFSPLHVPQARPASSMKDADDTLLQEMADVIPSPDNTPPKEAPAPPRTPVTRSVAFTTPVKTSTTDRTVYFSPSLFLEEQPSMRSDSDGDASLEVIVAADKGLIKGPGDGRDEEARFVRLVQGLIKAQDVLLVHRDQRYGIVMSLAENLRQDLVMKDEMVKLLEQDKADAEVARDEAVFRARDLQERVKQAARDQESQRQQQCSRFEAITAKLSSLMSTSAADRQSDPEVARLTDQLEEAKNAVVAVQPLLDSYRDANAELEAANNELTRQAEDAKTQAVAAAEELMADKDRLIEDLRKTLDKLQANMEKRAVEQAASKDELVDRVELLEDELEIQWGAAEQLAVEKHGLVEQNAALKIENEELRATLDRTAAQQVTITEERERFVADLVARVAMLEEEQRDRLDALAEARTRAQAAEERLVSGAKRDGAQEQLEAELEDCKGQLAKVRATSADQTVKIAALRKVRTELKDDILGLNVALEAKQQEVSYLKRQLRRDSDPATQPATQNAKVVESAPRRKPLAPLSDVTSLPSTQHSSKKSAFLAKLQALPGPPPPAKTPSTRRGRANPLADSQKENVSPTTALAARSRADPARLAVVA